MKNYNPFISTFIPLLLTVTLLNHLDMRFWPLPIAALGFHGFYSFLSFRRGKKKEQELESTAKEYSEQNSQLESTIKNLSQQQVRGKESHELRTSSKDTYSDVQNMIEKNIETIERMTEAVEVSQYIAVKGKDVVHEMLMAVNEIHSSNEKIFQTIEQNNQRISEVVQVISAIDEKTKIINDIVFQTKLLSFNASLEAARAGENGKGFMVVAEEVGKLATMSGDSAKEISQSLAENIEKVKFIVNESNGSIQEQVRIGKDKVEVGKITATESDIVLDEVVRNINKATNWINEITEANYQQKEFIQKASTRFSE